MIAFPCHCGEAFEVGDNLAGGLLQCPKCGRLNDVPTLDEARHIRPDGTYDLDLIDAPSADEELQSLSRVYGPKKTPDGEEVDLRQPVEQSRRGAVSEPAAGPGASSRVGSSSPRGAGSSRAGPSNRAIPKYDPITGELVRDIDLKPTEEELLGPIPVAKAALTYATERVKHTLTAPRLALELFMPLNIFVMFMIFLLHALAQVIADLASRIYVLSILLIATIPIAMALIAHYAHVIEETGPEGRDELPRPLRDADFFEDLWFPAIRCLMALAICFGPAVLARAQIPDPALAGFVAWPLFGIGLFLLPAVLLTTITGGSLHNLRPDRVLGVILQCGGGYLIACLAGVAAVGMYLWNVFGPRLLPDAWFAAAPWLAMIDTAPIVYPLLAVAVYLGHFFAWYIGLLHRRHHESFPWVLQRHVSRPRGV